MSITDKLRTARIASWVCLAIVILSTGRMIAPGISGDTAKVRFYFVVMMVAVVGGVYATLRYYYLKSKIQTYDLGVEIEAKTLEHAGQHLDDDKNQSPTDVKN